MARPASIGSLSLMDLKRAIRERRRDLQKLERNRAKVQKKLDLLDRKIASLAGGAPGGSRRGGRGTRPRNEGSLSEAIVQVLSKAGGPMAVGAIMEKMQAGGYRSGSANFRGVVNQRLISDKQFKSAGRGLYQFDGAAAAKPPGRKRRTARVKK